LTTIPKNGGGAVHFLKDGELSGETGVNLMMSMLLGARDESGALSHGIASDDDLQVGLERKSCFVEERDVRYKEPNPGLFLRVALSL
jgi:hypothetical protein